MKDRKSRSVRVRVGGKDGACVGSRDRLRLFLFFDKTSLHFSSDFVRTPTTDKPSSALESTGINGFWFNLSASCTIYTRHASRHSYIRH
ncbi:hypothetical protein DTO013E5_6447 [Penicillium roqueforti]|nr:hypothetical protein CBS147355_9732 [Penicillium roqueforti]KAI2672824.1 hypothetical protein LCP963914a_9325 [Penicillium roqueforti]KAI2711536.1 hypothetical protein CBS147354_8232 [Penicillium roqueforti]KAI2718324.1 hypothetical protein CBS147318_4901 [Penicillium roqueforti]KAI2734919.1 hypothetical protein DTO012A1_9633 [Penicillium roqueforti]